MIPSDRATSKTLRTDRLIVSLILEADETDQCLTRWLTPSSRPSALWQGKSSTAAFIILSLTQDTPPGPVGRYGWQALHICTGTYGSCLNWRHLYWGKHRDNVLDWAHGVIVQPQQTRLPKEERQLFQELLINRSGWQRTGWRPLIRQAKETPNARQGAA